MYMNMKKLFNILMSLTLVAALTGCNFLDRPSKTVMDDSNFWTSETNIRYFVNGAYTNYFPGYNSSWTQNYAPGVYSNGEFSDDGTSTGQQTQPRQTVPGDNWYRAEGGYWLFRTGAAPWNFGWVRKWNLLMDRLDMMKEEGILDEEPYNHWYGVARFFRGYEYSRIVQSFGDAPWYDYVVESTDYDAQYADRDNRTTVMSNVLEDFKFALENVRTNDGANFVNKYIVATIASRCMLFEGTWYKYHINDAAMAAYKAEAASLQNTFLTAAKDFAAFVMESGKYSFDTDFRTLFGSEKQTGNEIIMYRSYSADAAINVTHCIASYSNLDENQARSANLAHLRSWICNDGLPYAVSTTANADDFSMQELVKSRDPRFEATFWHQPTQAQTSVYCVKFIDRVGPTYGYNEQPRPAKYGSMTNTNGFPVLRYAEVVLNWIEAKAELGENITDADLNASINAIRQRPLDAEAEAKGVKKTAPLTMAMVSADSDPMRVSAPYQNTHAGVCSPILWEIRRERRMEFFMEQHRVLDIRRWGWLELMNASVNPEIQYGCWMDFNDTKNNLKAFNLLTGANFGKVGVMKEDGTIVMFDGEKDADGNILSSNAADMVGYRVVQNFKDRDRMEEKHYLEPICKDVLNQYKDAGYTIKQNAGWE